MIEIREERDKDVDAVRKINERVFEQPEEAAIVDRLRDSGAELLSLVAGRDGRLVGHILFSPVTIDSGGVEVRGMGLAPMAVLPEFQRQGIGSLMVRRGLDMLREGSCPFVIVLGHADYYPRFGFEPASRYGVECSWDGVPDEAFMILVMDSKVMHGVAGIARYRPEFDAAV